MASTYRIETLGCKANLYDSRRLAEALEALGLRPAGAREPVALCVLNTCTVTAAADRKSRKLAARLVRENPGARVLVTGCYATAAPADLRAIAGVTGVYGRNEWPDLLKAANGAGAAPSGAAPLLGGDFGIRSFDGRSRAFLKVQEGCDSFCSYCILPFVRGEPRSRPLADVRAEAARLAEAGFAEVVVTGIHVGLYGTDLPGRPTLAQALLCVADTPGVQRVRLSSIEVGEVTDDLLEAMVHPALCPHLHIPLQSGDAAVLRAMNRRYTPEEFLSAVERARVRLDRPAITTDVMVGFPGETDEAFGRALAVCRTARFSRIHVFPYSPRPGTAAAEMPGRVPAKVVAERSRRARELGKGTAVEWAQSFVGRRERVLFERCTGRGELSGYTDRYVRFTCPGQPDLVGRAARVVCISRRGASLSGRVLAP